MKPRDTQLSDPLCFSNISFTISFTYCSIEISPKSISLAWISPLTIVSCASMARVPGEDLNSLTSPLAPS